MTDDRLDELLGAYVLGAVDDDERAQLDELLTRSPAVRAELARLEHALGALTDAEATTVPPTGAWDRLVGVLHADPPADPRSGVVSPHQTRPNDPGTGARGSLPPLRLPRPQGVEPVAPAVPLRRHRWTQPLLAAAAVVMVVGLATAVVVQQRRIDRGTASLPVLAELALADPGSMTGSLDAADGSVHVRAVIDRDGTGYLFADELPALTDGRVYQLWTVDGAVPVSLGILGNDPKVVTFPTGGEARTLAITAERRPGATSPTGNPVVVGKVASR